MPPTHMNAWSSSTTLIGTKPTIFSADTVRTRPRADSASASAFGSAEARAMVPALTILDHDPDADLTTLNAIADWCDRFTPLVALGVATASTVMTRLPFTSGLLGLLIIGTAGAGIAPFAIVGAVIGFFVRQGLDRFNAHSTAHAAAAPV